MTIHSADIIQPSECVVHSRRPGENSQTPCREELESKHIFGAAVELLNLFFLRRLIAQIQTSEIPAPEGEAHADANKFL